MSELVIRSGASIDVDTASLRAAAGSIATIATDTEDQGALLRGAALQVDAAGTTGAFAQLELTLLSRAVEAAVVAAQSLAGALTRAAELYETVELLVARDVARAAGDAEALDRAERMLRVAAETPGLVDAAQQALDRDPDAGLVSQAITGGLLLGPGAALGLLAARGGVRALDRGVLASGARLRGDEVPVSIRPVQVGATTPPATLAEAASRIPGGGESRVRVERYVGPSGAAQFALYVAGTQSGSSGEAFDMRSNVELYDGARSASSAAVTQALASAGARPGDTVHAFAHSQGAMVTERLALEGEYDVRTLVSFGSPVQAEVSSDTLAVSVRHADDPVALLQGGGHPLPVGAPDSFVVERVVDPLPGPHDLALPGHRMDAYEQTAALIDASPDPRADALREALRGWGAEGEAVEFAAERVSPPGAGAG